MNRSSSFLPLCIALALVACTDVPQPTAAATNPSESAISANRIGRRAERFVSIGTSVSMGWQSDGVYELSQLVSWPALLQVGTGRLMSLPLIQSPGCQSPLRFPLSSGTRLSGESAAGSSVCAALRPGVTLPTQNVAIAGALARDAVATPPELGAGDRPWYNRVLPPGTTQLSATLAQHATFVSVELGANEVLNALSGLVAPGVTVVPFPYFAGPYDALLDALGATDAGALLVGLPLDARNFPALRRGDEIWADRLEFAALNVGVSADCDGSPNYVNVAIKSLTLVFSGAFASAHGYPTPVFSCADVPGTQDQILSPEDIAVVNGMLAQMNDHIRQQAALRGYAYSTLGALYDRGEKGGAYSVIRQLTSPLPYGPYFSLDGVHPNVLGHSLLAVAAARGINTTYGPAASRATEPAIALLPATATAPSPSSALALARRVAAEHAGMRLSQCVVPGCR